MHVLRKIENDAEADHTKKSVEELLFTRNTNYFEVTEDLVLMAEWVAKGNEFLESTGLEPSELFEGAYWFARDTKGAAFSEETFLFARMIEVYKPSYKGSGPTTMQSRRVYENLVRLYKPYMNAGGGLCR